MSDLTSSTLTVTVLSAGLSQPSATRLLADRMTQATVEALEQGGHTVEVKTFELREYAREVMDHMVTGFGSERLESLKAELTNSRAVVAVSPIFSQSVSGLFKSFLDILDTKSLANKPVFLGATAGTKRHSLALEYAIRPVFSYLRAHVAPTLVFAASDDWGANEDGIELQTRITKSAQEFAAMITGAGLADTSQQVGFGSVDFNELLRARGIGM